MEESEKNPADRTLPEKYTYREVSQTANEWIFRIVEVRDESDAEEWLKEYSELTKTTWRVARTWPYGRFNTFKKDYRCSHFTDRRATGQRSSKHTGCQAMLFIVVKRFIINAKHQDMLNQTHPCTVRFKNKHNHAVISPSVLKYRDLSLSVKQKLINLFHQGHTVISALKRYKADLMAEKGEDFHQAVVDGKLMPSYSKLQKLFEKEFLKTYGTLSCYKEFMRARRKCLKNTSEKSVSKRGPVLVECHSLGDVQLPSASSAVQDKNKENCAENEGESAVQGLLTEHIPSLNGYSEVDQQLPSPSSSVHDGNEDAMCQDESDQDENNEELKKSLSDLEGFFKRIKEGMRSKPDLFLPAVQKMMVNVSKNAATETGLLNALETFGAPPVVQGALKQNSTENIKNDCVKRINVLPPTSTNYPNSVKTIIVLPPTSTNYPNNCTNLIKLLPITQTIRHQ